MKIFGIATAVLAMAAVPALATEATFERNLTVNGRVELSVSTGSGNIHLTHGSGNTIHIHGRVKSNWGSGNNDSASRTLPTILPSIKRATLSASVRATRTTTTSASITTSKRPPTPFLRLTRARAM